MDRRTLLRTGLAGLSVGLAGLSGCSQLTGGGGGEQTSTLTVRGGMGTNTQTATSSGTPTANQVDRALETASTAVVRNNEQFVSFADQVRATDQSTPSSFDAAAVRDRLGTADQALSRASSAGGGGNVQSAIEALRNLMAAQRPAAGFFAQYPTISQHYTQVDRATDQQQYQQALSRLDTLEQTIGDARGPVDSALAAVAFIDTDDYGSLPVDASRFQTAFDTVHARYTLFSDLIGALRPYINGIQQLQSGSTAYDNGQYSTAATRFERAESSFRRANAGFRDLSLEGTDLSQPPGFEARLDQLVCATDSSATAANRFKQSANAAAQGNGDRAQTLVEQARNAIQRCQISS